MRFGTKQIPGSLHQLARKRMLEVLFFTPADLKGYLIAHGREDMLSVSCIEHNHGIIAERVMRAAIKELVGSNELARTKRGLWSRTGKTP